MLKIALLLATLGILVGCGTSSKNTVLPLPTPTPKVENNNSIPAIPDTTTLGSTAFEKGDYDEAIRLYSEVLDNTPNEETALLYRGRAYSQIGEFAQAEQDLSQVNSLTGQIYYVRALLAQDKAAPAQKVLSSILADPQFTKLNAYLKFLAFYMDGHVKNMSGQFDLALEPLEEAINLFERGSRDFAKAEAPHIGRIAYYQRAMAFHMKGRNQQAASDMERYIDLTTQAGQEVSPKDYKSLVLAHYLSENLAKCREYVPKLNDEDRQELLERFHNDTVFQK